MYGNNIENNENSNLSNNNIGTIPVNNTPPSVPGFSVQQTHNDSPLQPPLPELSTNIDNSNSMTGLSEKEIFELEMKQFLESDIPSPSLAYLENNNISSEQKLIANAVEQPMENEQIVPEYTNVPSIFGHDAGVVQSGVPEISLENNPLPEQTTINTNPIIEQPLPNIPNQSDNFGVGGEIKSIQNENISNNIGEVSNIVDVPNQTNNVNFFAYDFAAETKNQIGPIETETKVSEELLQFDFDSVIRDQSPKEVVPVDNRIELNKLLEPKENLIKKPGEANPNDNNVININEDDGKKYRRKKAFMKASLYAFYLFLIFFVSVFAYTIYQQKTAFSLNRNEISLAINSTYQAEVIMDAMVQDSSNYEWSSADTSVATVSEDGIVTAIKTGSTVITVKSKKTRKTNELLVTTISITVDSIRFNRNSVSLTVDESTTLSPIINEDSTIIIDLTWESSNPDIVSVDSNGKITAISAGTATIIAIEEVSGLAAEIEIKVNPKKSSSNNSNTNNNNSKNNEKVAVSGISLNQSNTSLKIGNSVTVTATVRPANATNKNISWSTSNKNIVTVNNSGKITAISAGTATITAKTADGNKTATIKITVTEDLPTTISVTAITLSKSNVALEIDDTTTLIATILPDNATNKEVSWSSSDSSVATVNSSGKITAVSAGTATITVKTADGNKTATCIVTVTTPEPTTISVTGVTLNHTNIILIVGGDRKLNANISPGNATNKEVSWSSSDSSVATVNSSGQVTAVSAGTATITVKTADGNKTATCIVTVTDDEDEE